MANVKISELAELTTPATDDKLVIVDASEALDADKTKYITVGNLRSGIGFTPQFRISLVSGNPASNADTTKAGTIYYTPYGGNCIQLYTGSVWKTFALTELSLALTVTDKKLYDVFVDYNAGTPQLVLSAAWTNDTTRADSLAYQDGRLVKSGTPKYLYVGTIGADGTNKTTDSRTKRYVYNHYNKIFKPIHEYTTTPTDYWFVVGDPNGCFMIFGGGGTFKNGKIAYLYSSVNVDTLRCEIGMADTEPDPDGTSNQEVELFPTGLNYIKFSLAGGGTIERFRLYGNWWC